MKTMSDADDYDEKINEYCEEKQTDDYEKEDVMEYLEQEERTKVRGR